MLRAGQIIQLTVMAMLAFAVLMVHSAGMSVEAGPVSFSEMLMSRHAAYAGLGVAACLAASQVDLRRALRWRGLGAPIAWALCASIVLCGLTLVPGVGKNINGASRWLAIGPRAWGLQMQPSELLKWVMVAAVAAWATRRAGVLRSFRHGLLPIGFVVAVGCGVVVIEDLGTAVLIAAVAGGMLLLAGCRLGHLLVIALAAAPCFAVFVLTSPYRLKRLMAFADPWADPHGAGYHPIQSMLAISQGGLAGRGLGNGVQKFGYLPEDTTDFIFAVICEELGLAGASLVVAMLLTLIWAGLSIARRNDHSFVQLFAAGVAMTLGFQAMINLAVVTVLAPTKGIALPLISAGGTGWVLTATALGLLAGMDRADVSRAEADRAGRAHAGMAREGMARA